MLTFDFTGQVALITGAGRGIGREYARLFAAEGAHVVVDNRCAPELAGGPEDTAAAVVDEIRAAGGSAVASHADVTSMAGAEALFGLALDTWGEVHAVVNNAGAYGGAMADVVVSATVRTPEGEARYRLCSTDGHHHHLVCRQCGHTVEVEGPAVERWATQTAEKHGFTGVSHTVEVFGTCQDCAQR